MGHALLRAAEIERRALDGHPLGLGGVELEQGVLLAPLDLQARGGPPVPEPLVVGIVVVLSDLRIGNHLAAESRPDRLDRPDLLHVGARHIQDAEEDLPDRQEVHPVAQGIAADHEVLLGKVGGIARGRVYAVFLDQGAKAGRHRLALDDLGMVVHQGDLVLLGQLAHIRVDLGHARVAPPLGRDGVQDRNAVGIEAHLDDLLQIGPVVSRLLVVGPVGADHDDRHFGFIALEHGRNSREQILDFPGRHVGVVRPLIGHALQQVAPAFLAAVHRHGGLGEAVIGQIGLRHGPIQWLPEWGGIGDGVAELGDIAGIAVEFLVQFLHGLVPIRRRSRRHSVHPRRQNQTNRHQTR